MARPTTSSSRAHRPTGNEPGAVEPTWVVVPVAANPLTTRATASRSPGGLSKTRRRSGFEAYLKPVTPEDAAVVINHEGSATSAAAIGPRTYLVESNAPDGSRVSFEYTLDGAGLRVVGDDRLVHVPSQYEANATIEVLDSGPTTLPAGIFDTSTFTPLWGGNPPPTTEATTP